MGMGVVASASPSSGAAQGAPPPPPLLKRMSSGSLPGDASDKAARMLGARKRVHAAAVSSKALQKLGANREMLGSRTSARRAAARAVPSAQRRRCYASLRLGTQRFVTRAAALPLPTWNEDCTL